MAKAKPKARAKVRRYDEGGDVPDDVKAANETDDPIYALGKSRGWFKEDDGGDTAPAKTQSFGQAFKVARANYLAGTGGKNFTWNGKSYSTDIAGSKSPAPAPKAKASPSSASDKFGAFDPGSGANDWMNQAVRPADEPGLEGVYPEQYLSPARAAAGVTRALATTVGRRAAPALNEYVMPLLGREASKLTGPAAQRALADNATRMLTGPTKAELMAAQRATRASGRYEDMLNQNAQAAGVSPGSPAAQYLASKMKQLGMKKGGVVKMAKGGSVSSASKRADGIARKGLTKGRMR